MIVFFGEIGQALGSYCCLMTAKVHVVAGGDGSGGDEPWWRLYLHSADAVALVYSSYLVLLVM